MEQRLYKHMHDASWYAAWLMQGTGCYAADIWHSCIVQDSAVDNEWFEHAEAKPKGIQSLLQLSAEGSTLSRTWQPSTWVHMHASKASPKTNFTYIMIRCQMKASIL